MRNQPTPLRWHHIARYRRRHRSLFDMPGSIAMPTMGPLITEESKTAWRCRRQVSTSEARQQGRMRAMTATVPIAVIATELDVDVNGLAAHWAEDIVFDAAGCRTVPVEFAKSYLDEIAAASERLAAARHERRRHASAQYQAEHEDLRRRREAIEARDARILAGDGSLDALAVMMSCDLERDLDRQAEKNERLRRGESWGATFSPKGY